MQVYMKKLDQNVAMEFFQTIAVGRSGGTKPVDPTPVDPKPGVPEDWAQTTMQLGNFKVSWPREGRTVKVEELPVLADLSGVITNHHVTQCTYPNGVILRATYSPLPNESLSHGAEAILDARQKTYEKNETLKDVKKIKVFGHPARDSSFETKNGFKGRQRFIVIDRMIYELRGGSTSGALSDKDLTTFIESFTLIKPVPPPGDGGGDKPKDPPPQPPKGGASSGDIPKATKLDHLKQIGLAYHNHFDSANGVGPASVEKLAPLVENNPKILTPIKEGKYVVYWGVKLFSMTAGTSNTVLGHESDTPTKGGLVLMGDGSVKQMTVQEFQKAPKAGR
jgi:hypothetical protein